MGDSFTESFAAIVPVGGALGRSQEENQAELESILNPLGEMPIRIFHGSNDPVIPAFRAEVLYQTLKKLGTQDIEIDIREGLKHGPTRVMFTEYRLYKWLFSR